MSLHVEQSPKWNNDVQFQGVGEQTRRKEQALARVKQILDSKSVKSRMGLGKQSSNTTGRKP